MDRKLFAMTGFKSANPVISPFLCDSFGPHQSILPWTHPMMTPLNLGLHSSLTQITVLCMVAMIDPVNEPTKPIHFAGRTTCTGTGRHRGVQLNLLVPPKFTSTSVGQSTRGNPRAWTRFVGRSTASLVRHLPFGTGVSSTGLMNRHICAVAFPSNYCWPVCQTSTLPTRLFGMRRARTVEMGQKLQCPPRTEPHSSVRFIETTQQRP